MPAGVISKFTALTTTQNSNVLSGSQFTLVTEPSVVSVALLGSGTAPANILASINCGNRIVMEPSAVPVADTGQTWPRVPDQFMWTFPALPGEIIQITAQTSSSTANMASVVQIAAA